MYRRSGHWKFICTHCIQHSYIINFTWNSPSIRITKEINEAQMKWKQLEPNTLQTLHTIYSNRIHSKWNCASASVRCWLSVVGSSFHIPRIWIDWNNIRLCYGFAACACVCTLHTFECGCVYSFSAISSSFFFFSRWLNNDAWVLLFTGTLLHFSILLKGEQDTSARSVHFQICIGKIVGKCFVCYEDDTRTWVKWRIYVIWNVKHLTYEYFEFVKYIFEIEIWNNGHSCRWIGTLSLEVKINGPFFFLNLKA